MNISITRTNNLVPFETIITVCSDSHRKYINTLRGQNVEFFNVSPGGTQSNHGADRVQSSSGGT